MRRIRWAAASITVGIAGLGPMPVAAEPPTEPPAAPPVTITKTVVIGSIVRVPAPCRLTRADDFQYELDPNFASPVYFIQLVSGPPSRAGTVRLQIPADATPGSYTLRGICMRRRGPNELTSASDQYAAVRPVIVELVPREHPTAVRRAHPARPVRSSAKFSA